MPLLYPSTVEIIKLCANMVVRAITVSVCWLALMGIGVVLNWALEYLFNATDAPAPIRDLFQPMTWGIPILLGVGIMATSLIDVFRLVKMSWESPYGSEDRRKMNAKLSEYVSFRDVPFALVCAIIWFVVLWADGYPTDERVGVALIAYVALWTSRMIINALALSALKRLHSLTLRKADELGVAIPEEPSPAIATTARAVVAVFLLAMFSAIVGMSVIAAIPIVVLVGLPPLSAGFGVFGLAAFGAGAFVFAAVVGVPFVLFKWPERVAVFARLSSRPSKNFAWS